MKSEGVSEARLTVAVVEHRLKSDLEPLGFVPVKSKSLKLIKRINDDTEVFLYPGVMRSGAAVRVDPVIGVDNVTLRQRLLAANRQRWSGSYSVCHAYLGVLASWNNFYLRTSAELDRAAAEVVQSVVEGGLPIMSEFDTLDKVRRLFRAELAGPSQTKVAVLFAKEKLAQIEMH